ncbi:transaldolase family protein [Clostridium chauvoei]|uniref:Fructose-6-phosphate aldolase n=2 Tax=Clostridium chauvoei TaxID=46867 RepID=A0ABD4RJF2_9CLOT|nr:transaldolase family protein [Clostridium chauvoei]ATD55543.1 fructose-6-phosphate aldolase [Clostridium chauvoei]ATD56781.1 fructose-6-phosphate aldolase [Clostridium chauvoei]MBX7281231.1 fructose-6-phosphate aldolase [Clostridium chauvoei]MBX7283713.1 fructose-6-phosphate aldolase [Clostridium chauvoei]MBX7286321.1 fructose-6-phosphate aldolase [Clostridium chauvoei]
MVYMIDIANINEIKEAKEYYPLCGVTTNPSSIAKEGRNSIELLKEIRKVIGNDAMIHVQVLSTKAENMIEDAEYLKSNLQGNIYISIPVIKEGIKAIKILKNRGYKITATAIVTVQQGLMAAMAGADYIVPYINEIDNLNGGGVGVVEALVNLIKEYKLDTKVLSSSFKSTNQVNNIINGGGHAISLNKEIFDNLLDHPMTDLCVEGFIEDWKKTFGVSMIL